MKERLLWLSPKRTRLSGSCLLVAYEAVEISDGLRTCTGLGPAGSNETPCNMSTHYRKVYNMGWSRPRILPELLSLIIA